MANKCKSRYKFKVIKPEFRTHKTNGHPAYIYAKNDNEYKYIGITHSPNTHGLKNKKLRYRLSSSDTKDSYLRPFSTHDKIKKFKNKKIRGLKVHKADKKTVRKIKKNYKA